MTEMGLSITGRVQEIAKVIRLFSTDELRQLMLLVPQLGEIPPPPLSVDETEAVAHFRKELVARRKGKSPASDEPFIGGLTLSEYIALSEAEEVALWDKLSAESKMKIEQFEECDVKPDARQACQQ